MPPNKTGDYMIKVKVKAKNPETVALWERNPAHPNGEVYITGDKVFEVAKTDAVVSRLKSGLLVEVKPVAQKPTVKRRTSKKAASK